MFAILIFYSRSYYVSTGAKSWFAVGPLPFSLRNYEAGLHLDDGRVITTITASTRSTRSIPTGG